ncbi:MAG: response regulator transcription factor [Culicoidibacterales bacterium]
MAKILLVEDNEEYLAYLESLLVSNGYEVISTYNPIVALELFELSKFDFVISDLMMEGMDGVKFMSFIKRRNPLVPTMILTGHPSNSSELESLELYVDKYLTKDISRDVLLRSIEYVLSLNLEYREIKDEILVSNVNHLKMDLKGHKVYKNGAEVMLANKDFLILKLFLENKNYLISRDEMIERVWKLDAKLVEERVVDVHISVLRRALKLTAIVSIRGVGYRWDE